MVYACAEHHSFNPLISWFNGDKYKILIRIPQSQIKASILPKVSITLVTWLVPRLSSCSVKLVKKKNKGIIQVTMKKKKRTANWTNFWFGDFLQKWTKERTKQLRMHLFYLREKISCLSVDTSSFEKQNQVEFS